MIDEQENYRRELEKWEAARETLAQDIGYASQIGNEPTLQQTAERCMIARGRRKPTPPAPPRTRGQEFADNLPLSCMNDHRRQAVAAAFDAEIAKCCEQTIDAIDRICKTAADFQAICEAVRKAHGQEGKR